MTKRSKKPENVVPKNEKQAQQKLYNFGRCLIEEALKKPRLFFDTLKVLHKSMGKTFKSPAKFNGVKINLHQIFKEVCSRGGIRKVISENTTQGVCTALGNASIAKPEHLSTVYSTFLLDQYELLSFNTDQTQKPNTGQTQKPNTDQTQKPNTGQTQKPPRSDPHIRTVKQGLSPLEAVAPQNSAPKAGDNTTTISTSLSSSNRNSSVTTLPAKMRCRPRATLQQNPEFHSSDTKSSTRALPAKEVGGGALSKAIPESHFSDRISTRSGVRQRPPKQIKGPTLKRIPEFDSSDKRSLSTRTLPGKEVTPGATSEGIPEFHFSSKGSSSISDVRSMAPQKQIQDPSLLQSIPQSNDLFFREQQMGTDRAAKRQKELVGTNLDGKDEVGTKSYAGTGPEGKVSSGNRDLKEKHLRWGEDLSLAAGHSSSRLLSKAKQVEDKDLDVNR